MSEGGFGNANTLQLDKMDNVKKTNNVDILKLFKTLVISRDEFSRGHRVQNI